MCGLCHTVIDRTGIYNVDGAFLARGMRVGYYPHGYSVSRNLTSDLETGLAGGACRRSSVRCAMAKRRTGCSIRSRCHGRFFTTSQAKTRRRSQPWGTSGIDTTHSASDSHTNSFYRPPSPHIGTVVALYAGAIKRPRPRDLSPRPGRLNCLVRDFVAETLLQSGRSSFHSWHLIL